MLRIATVSLVAILAAASLISTSAISAVFANNGDLYKDPRCTKDTSGSGNPHDAQNPQNPHDTQLGYSRGNPHDACKGS